MGVFSASEGKSFMTCHVVVSFDPENGAHFNLAEKPGGLVRFFFKMFQVLVHIPS